jgi:hypothetical protein
MTDCRLQLALPTDNATARRFTEAIRPNADRLSASPQCLSGPNVSAHSKLLDADGLRRHSTANASLLGYLSARGDAVDGRTVKTFSAMYRASICVTSER